MKFGDSGNVITERVLNFTETFVCLERLDRERTIEVPGATIMKRKSATKTTPAISASPRKETLRSPGRAEAISRHDSNPRTKVHSSKKKQAGERDATKSAAKRNLIQSKTKIPLSDGRKAPNREEKLAKQANESKEGRESLREDFIAISSMKKFQTEELRECSVILKTVHIPETVYLDPKTKRRLSSLFKVSRKSAKGRSRVNCEDAAGMASVSNSEPADDLVRSEVDQVQPSKAKGRGRPSTGKRKRDEADGTPVASTSKSQRRSSNSERNSTTTPRGNPPKRRRASAKASSRQVIAKGGSERGEEAPMDCGDRERSLSWDENPSPRKPADGILRDSLTSASDGKNGPLEASDSATVSERLALLPASYNPSDKQRGPQRPFVILQQGRCAHCSCSCVEEEVPVDKNQPLITEFLRRTPKGLTPDVASRSTSNIGATETDSAVLSQDKQRDAVNGGSPSKDVLVDEESPAVDVSAEEDSATQPATTEEADLNSKEDSATQPETTEDAELASKEASATQPESTEEAQVESEEDSATQLETTGEVSGDARSLEAMPVDASMGESESLKYSPARSSSSEVKLVLEEGSDDSLVDRSDATGVATIVTSKSPPASDGSLATEDDKHEIPTDTLEAAPKISEQCEAKAEERKKNLIDLGLIEETSQDSADITDDLISNLNPLVEPKAPKSSEQDRVDDCDDRKIPRVPNNTEETDAIERTDVVPSCGASSGTKLDEPIDTASETRADQEESSRAPDEDGERSHDDTKEPPALDDEKLGGSCGIGVESERTAGILLNNGKRSVPSLGGCEDHCDEKITVLEAPTVAATAGTKNHADENAATSNDASVGAAVLCFLGVVSRENRASDEDGLTHEASQDAFFEAGSSTLDREQLGIDLNGAVAELPPTV